jgi:HSP20 family protein
MAIIARSPFEDLLNDIGKGFWVKPVPFPAETEVRIKVDVKEDEKSYTVNAEIPGVKKEDIRVDVEGNQVSLRAEVRREKEDKQGEKVIHSERAYGMASRSFTLPMDVDADGARAEYKDGVLSLVLPKKSGGNGQRIAIS